MQRLRFGSGTPNTSHLSLRCCRAEGTALLAPVALLHVAAFSMGYFLSKLAGFNEKTARTVSIETGAQSPSSRSA